MNPWRKMLGARGTGLPSSMMKTTMSGPVPILPLPVLDTRASALESPHVVRVLARIRFEVMDDHPDGECMSLRGSHANTGGLPAQ